MAKEISDLKLECAKHESRHKASFDLRLSDIEKNKRLERELIQ